MRVEEYDHVRLTNGLTGHIIEVWDGGAAYEFERDDAPSLPDDVPAWYTISPDDVEKVLP